MFCPKVSLKKAGTLALTTAALISLSHVALPVDIASGHEVKIAEDVGATLHIEPNDIPKAGEEVLAWFALTRPGGETIPLANCDCTLTIYAQPKDQPYEGKTPELTPTLSAVDAEGYQDIPGARLTFPDVGTYTLVISGEPKQEGDFTPFTLDFEKTIASGIPKIPENAETALPPPEESSDDLPAVEEERPVAAVGYVKWAIAGIGIAGLIWAISSLFRRPK